MTRSSGSLFYRPKSRSEIVRQKRWNIWEIVKKVAAKVCMTIGAVVLFSAFLAGFLNGAMRQTGPVMPSEMVLTLNLENGIGERPAQPSLSNPFPQKRPTVRDVVGALEAAAEDGRVKGLVVRLEGSGVGLAHIEEIRPAIDAFRKSGKTATIYSSSYGGIGAGLGTFYLASAFDEIWMQPIGMVSFSGLAFEMPYGRGLLEKIGVRPQFFQRESYKGAMENFTNKHMSEESRETFNAIADDFYERAFTEIADRRKISEPELKKALEKGLLTGQEALETGLIDRLDYADVLLAETRTALGYEAESKKPEMISLMHYAGTIGNRHFGFGKSKEVALIYATGQIMPTAQGNDGAAAADEIAGAINMARDDQSIEAIILRIDSPGGSPSASETIRRAILRAKEKGKKVVVSMGSVAASGGYWIAADADKIYALPSTLTGSIGVIMGKFELSGLWEKIGVNWDIVQRGENAEMWSINRPFDTAESRRMNVIIDDTYNSFLERVATGRKLSLSAVREIAQGRAWTGTEALGKGLVDEMGGLNDALDYTAKQLGLESRHQLRVTVLPKPQSALEQFTELLGAQAALARFIQIVMPFEKELAGAVQASQIKGIHTYDFGVENIAP